MRLKTFYMILSINIPTYNRVDYLVKNLGIIIKQIYELEVVNDVEINITDNASTDLTENSILQIIKENPKLNVHYTKNKENYGGEVNLIKAMNMAHGQYSILLGDDDFFQKDALRKILLLLAQFPNNSVFLYNRTDINTKGYIIEEKKFLKGSFETQTFDFSNVCDGKKYFTLINTLGGALSFTSSVIYKTSILKEIGDFDQQFYGSYYPFHFYWWGYLLKGHKLVYINDSFLNCTIGSYNDDLGTDRINRKVVDFYGFNKIAKLLFLNTPYYQDYIRCPFVDSDPLILSKLYCAYPKKFEKQLLPFLLEAGWTNEYWLKFKRTYSLFGIIKLFVKSCISNIFRYEG